MGRIAILLPTLDPGGAERVMLNLSHGLVERGHAVDMVLGSAKGAFLPELDARIRLVDLAAPRVLQAFPALVRHLRSERPQVVISSLPHLNLAAILARSWSRIRTRLVLVEHGDVTLASVHGLRRWERFFPAAMRLLYPFSDAVVAVSQGVADGLVQRAGIPREKITVIHNPIVTPDIPGKAAAALDHPWFKAGGPPVIVAAGRLTVTKDYPTLLHAFALLRARRAARLMILGEGEMRAALEILAISLGIEADVELCGFQTNPFAFLGRSAVLALSSTWEGFGNVLVEALACGTQVVSTDCPGGPAEILEHGKYGRLVPVGDAPALAAALGEALDAPLPVEMLRERAQAFSVDAALEKYLHVMGLD